MGPFFPNVPPFSWLWPLSAPFVSLGILSAECRHSGHTHAQQSFLLQGPTTTAKVKATTIHALAAPKAKVQGFFVVVFSWWGIPELDTFLWSPFLGAVKGERGEGLSMMITTSVTEKGMERLERGDPNRAILKPRPSVNLILLLLLVHAHVTTNKIVLKTRSLFLSNFRSGKGEEKECFLL